MAKFLVLVIDSFGVGAMDDVPQVRPQDIGANTCAHILQAKPDLRLPVLEKLGMINALGFSANVMQPSAEANFGTADLQHEGGDTFMGHQEILGTKPKTPLRIPFSEVIDAVEQALFAADYQVERIGGTLQYLLVNQHVAIGDNLEADLGQVFNITANLSEISFEQVKKIGRIVRDCVSVDRVIAFGGLMASSQQILDAAEEKLGIYIGINAPKSGAYDKGFQVVHMGYGVDSQVQVPEKLHSRRIPTTLIGKVADIVDNPHGINHINLVDSQTIMDITLDAIKQPGDRFICTNIQETDLSGHAQNVERYADRLMVVDNNLADILNVMTPEDCLVVMADHGNDPTIGHSKHTREKVPLLVYRPGVTGVQIGHRDSLSDVGATVCDFFHAPAPQNGTSFLALLKAQE
ncbi:phosphopentomutase [Limnobaculum zhutongyuii]|uniref:Phosphopentomutase n=1 Tax=Limnobaculum zhutongyuii TaxID=2498113 RepID=A0A411WN83_9GAMM|nr:phosphopentomutase [Limnobaculum zhutongyuii]QBH97711.1 phosphopentomutase [Limnobaculum zhutongyuii]TQS86814.1 phosphopentomutase [Limnobaculum zhutongyuii]